MINRSPFDHAGPSRTDVAAVVKWYNPVKGFGFVQPNDGSPDAFLHVSVVEQAGYGDLPEGTSLVCDITEGRKGPQVSSIHRVELGAAPAPRSAPRMDRGGGMGYGGGSRDGGMGYGGGSRDSGMGYGGGGGGATSSVEGTVKFFNPGKGFGFVTPDDGGKDVFISARTLERIGINSLEPNQRVRLTTRMGQKGPMAEHIELL